MANENQEIDMDELNKKSKMDVKAKSFDVWKCMSCEGEPEFSRGEVAKHALEVHGVDIKTVKFQREMLMHLDGREWFQSNYEWKVDSMTLVNYSRSPRAKNDMMRFA